MNLARGKGLVCSLDDHLGWWEGEVEFHRRDLVALFRVLGPAGQDGVEVLSLQVLNGEAVHHPGVLLLKGAVHHLPVHVPDDRGGRLAPQHRAGDDQGLPELVRSQLAVHLSSTVVQDHRLRGVAVHREDDVGHPGGTGLEVDPADLDDSPVFNNSNDNSDNTCRSRRPHLSPEQCAGPTSRSLSAW